MADIHPYNQWLSLPVELVEPNHYQLLGLRDFESDEETIAIAADRALAKVRGYRPGVHAKAWSQLLDELYGAKTCLLDSASREEYDRGLRGRSDNSKPVSLNPAKADRLPPATVNPDRYPPGMGPKQYDASKRPTGSEPSTSPREGTEANQPTTKQSATTRSAPQVASAAASANSESTPVVTPATPADFSAPAVPVAYPVYSQMAGYAPQPGHLQPTGYAPQYSSPPGMVPGTSNPPVAMPYASPPSPPPALPPGAVPVAYSAYNAYGGSLDPMAPVAIPGVTPATRTSTPVGVAPVGGAIPVGTSVSMGSTAAISSRAVGADRSESNGAALVAAAGSLGEAGGVATSAKALAMRNARRADQAKQNLMFLAGAAGIALLAAGGIYFGMSGDGGGNANSTTVARNTHSDGNDAPAPMGRTLESDLPGGTPRRVNASPTNTTPPTPSGPVTVPASDQTGAMNASSPNSVGPDPALATPKPAPPGTVEQLPEMTAPAEPSPPVIPATSPGPAPDVPILESTPASNPTPEPMPPPVPAPAPESPPLSPQQLAALAEALTMGRAALSEQNFDEADKFIARAAELAQAEEHQQMVARLREIADYVRQFRAAVEAGAKSLETKDLQVGTSAFVSFVEVLPDRVIVRTAGQNRNYSYADLPPGLAQAIVDQQLDGSDPTSRVVKGAYYAVARGDRKTLLEKAQTWWEEAQLGGVEVAHLMPFLTDDYESVKSAGAPPEGNSASEPASE